MKFKLFSIFIIALLMITAGCIANSQHNNTQEKYNLKYDFKEGEQYSYEVLSIIEKPKASAFETVDINVVNVGNDYINLEMLSATKNNAESKKDSYSLNMTPDGEITEISSKNLIIPEIQLELVSILQYPEQEFETEDIWNSYFDKNDSYYVDSNLVEYTIFGNTTYECLGRDEISIDAGKFECVVIATSTNYTFDFELESENKSIYLKTTGITEGENWIDLDKGLLIKSEYNIDKNTITNYSNIYEEIGIKDAYRETPLKSHITSELVSIKGD